MNDFVKRMKLGLEWEMCDAGNSGEKTDAKWGLVSPSGWALPDSTLPSSLRPWQCSLSKSSTSLTLPPATARRSNRSILKAISPEYSLEGLMLKLKLQYSGHLMQRIDSFENTLMMGKIVGRRRRG